jgi:hypothetical protein
MLNHLKEITQKIMASTLVLSFLAGGIGGVVGSVLIAARVNAPLIATVDITALVHHTIQRESMQNLSEVELRMQLKAFSQSLEHALSTVARERDLILLPKEAVINGAIDATPFVEQQLSIAHHV